FRGARFDAGAGGPGSLDRCRSRGRAESDGIMTLLTSTHWGTYHVETRDGRVVALHPFEHDPDPSPLGASLIEGVRATCRVCPPAIRRGYLDRAVDSREGRGREAFVEVPWDE